MQSIAGLCLITYKQLTEAIKKLQETGLSAYRPETLIIRQKEDASSSTKPTRQMELTRWIAMKIDWDIKPWGSRTTLLASGFTWLLLAGFIVLPGTFASIRNSKALNDIGKTGRFVVHTVQHVQLLGLASFLCFIGASGIAWLWWKNNRNYIWLADRIFLYVTTADS
jgi:hypothetical protein